MGEFDVVELLEEFSRIMRRIVSEKNARIAELKAELAKDKRCTDVLCAHCHDVDKEGE